MLLDCGRVVNAADDEIDGRSDDDASATMLRLIGWLVVRVEDRRDRHTEEDMHILCIEVIIIIISK